MGLFTWGSGFISQRSRPILAMLLALASLVLTALADHFLPLGFGITLLYALPVLLLSWYFGPVSAIASVLAVCATWLALVLVADPRPDWYKLTWNFCNQALLLAIMATLVRRIRLLIQRSHESARRDTVTGLPNSRSFYESAEIEVMRAKRYGHPITMALIDLDDFKQINERFGHPVGDRLLAEFAHLAYAILRRTDIIARIGGDEFVVFMPETNQEEAKVPIDKIRECMDTVMKKHQWPVTLSIGVYTFLTMPNNLQVMITFADSLMYKVKQAGKNQVAYEVFVDDKADEIEDEA